LILIGSILFMIPAVHNNIDINYIDALFTSTSAVCVTGLATVDPGNTFNPLGRTILAILIQLGGLGLATISVGFFIFSGKKIGLSQRKLVKETLHYGSFKDILSFLKIVLFITFGFELIGMILFLFIFIKDYSFWDALGISAFHSISAFNNAGFDIMGNFQNLIPYQNNIALNIITSLLVIFGGLGFFVIIDIFEKRKFKKFSLQTKIVVCITATLLVIGTLLLKFTEGFSWLSAFSFSAYARTAGFSNLSLNEFTTAGLLILMALMFIGASPGSTGGGIKTTTFFVLLKAAYNAATESKPTTAFKKQIPHSLVYLAAVITFLSLGIIFVSTLLLTIVEPNIAFIDLVFEVVSAFGTVGLSIGITPTLSIAGKLIIILTMFFGRIGPLALASLWVWKKDVSYKYSEENISIG